MKKPFLLILLVMLPLLASADAVEVDGIYYDIVSDTKEAIVTSNPNAYTGDIVLPGTITYQDEMYTISGIAEYAFKNNDAMTSITIPTSIKTMGRDAFYECYGLKAVYISDLEKWCTIRFSGTQSNPLTYAHHLFLNKQEIVNLVFPDNINTVLAYTFCGCHGLASVVIPEGVQQIGNQAFYDCRGMSKIMIPSTVNRIGTYNFSYCNSLTTITLPENLTCIEYGLFYFNTALKSIQIPSKVTTINNNAFQYCTALTSITIPENVTTIGQEVFAGCDNMVDVKVLATNPPEAYANTFSNYYITLYIPEASANSYLTTSPWNEFTSFKTLSGKEIQKLRCANPSITMENGKLKFSCETEGVKYVYQAQPLNDSSYDDVEGLSLPSGFCVTVYATKDGYQNSETITKNVKTSIGETGDVNGDGKVTITDATKVVSIILNQK